MKRTFRRLLLASTLACAPVSLALAQDCSADSAATGTASAGFHVVNGQIIDPSGKVFVARGVSVSNSDLDADKLIAMLPGINLVRLAAFQYQDASAYTDFVNKMTAHGTVVSISDYQTSDGSDSGGSQGVVFTGQMLATELAWYSQVAAAFKGNPYVWFGTNNEPAVNGGSVSDWDVSIYQAVRNAGNTAPLLVDAWIWYGLDPAKFASLSNIVWDPHFYTQSTPETTDAVEAAMTQRFNEVTAIKTADGTAPVIFGEFGPEQDMWMGMVAQMVNDVAAGKWGATAWWWSGDGTWLALKNGQTLTDPYGQMIALWIGTDVAQPSACVVASRVTAAIAAATQTAMASSVPNVAGDAPTSTDAPAPSTFVPAAASTPAGSSTPDDDSSPDVTIAGLEAQLVKLQGEITALEQNARSTGPLGASAKVTPGTGSVAAPDGSGTLTITQNGSIMLGSNYVAGGGGTAAILVDDDVLYGLDDSGKGWFTYDPKAQVWTSSVPPAGT